MSRYRYRIVLYIRNTVLSAPYPISEALSHVLRLSWALSNLSFFCIFLFTTTLLLPGNAHGAWVCRTSATLDTCYSCFNIPGKSCFSPALISFTYGCDINPLLPTFQPVNAVLKHRTFCNNSRPSAAELFYDYLGLPTFFFFDLKIVSLLLRTPPSSC